MGIAKHKARCRLHRAVAAYHRDQSLTGSVGVAMPERSNGFIIMRVYILLSLTSLCCASRVALLFSNRTVAATVVANDTVIAVSRPRLEFFPKGHRSYWSSTELMNCVTTPECDSAPCSPECAFNCANTTISANGERRVGMMKHAPLQDLYMLIVHEKPSDWAIWRCGSEPYADAYQTVSVAMPGLGTWTGWQSVSMNAFAAQGTEDGLRISMRSGPCHGESKATQVTK